MVNPALVSTATAQRPRALKSTESAVPISNIRTKVWTNASPLHQERGKSQPVQKHLISNPILIGTHPNCKQQKRPDGKGSHGHDLSFSSNSPSNTSQLGRVHLGPAASSSSSAACRSRLSKTGSSNPPSVSAKSLNEGPRQHLRPASLIPALSAGHRGGQLRRDIYIDPIAAEKSTSTNTRQHSDFVPSSPMITFDLSTEGEETLLDIRMPLDDFLADSAPPSPLVSPHSPVLLSASLEHDLFPASTIGLDHVDITTTGSPNQLAVECTSEVLPRRPPTIRPTLKLDTIMATCERDELTRGIVSAIDHMLDDSSLLFPDVGLSPTDTSGCITPLSTLELCLPRELKIVDAYQAPKPIRDISLHMPTVHQDVWAAHWTLCRTKIDGLDAEDYLKAMTSPW